MDDGIETSTLRRPGKHIDSIFRKKFDGKKILLNAGKIVKDNQVRQMERNRIKALSAS